MAFKRQTKSDKLAGEVELAAFMIDNEADNLVEGVMASDLAHTTVEFEAGSLPLNVFLHALAAKLRSVTDEIRSMRT